ncbi:MAG: glycosyltransferase family 2 protein [Bacilli bacterium]
MKVSVIVPVFNVENYLEKCLTSLVNQTLKDIEIIIINDGSTDGSQKIIDKFKKENNNIKNYIQQNKGQASARNFGLQHCSAEYVTYVDSDDYIELDMMEKLYNNIKKNKYDIIISNIIKEEGNKKYIFKNFWQVKEEVNKNFMISHMGPVARLYRRKFLIDNKFKFLEGVIYEDLGSIPMLGMYTNKIGYVDEAYYHYVIRKGSIMKPLKYNKKMEDIFKVMNNLSNKINEEYKEELEYLYIEHLLYGASLRFVDFNKKDMLLKIKNIMHEKYPKYRNNIYYKNKSIKFKLICLLSYHGCYGIVKILKRISDNNG